MDGEATKEREVGRRIEGLPRFVEESMVAGARWMIGEKWVWTRMGLSRPSVKSMSSGWSESNIGVLWCQMKERYDSDSRGGERGGATASCRSICTGEEWSNNTHVDILPREY